MKPCEPWPLTGQCRLRGLRHHAVHRRIRPLISARSWSGPKRRWAGNIASSASLGQAAQSNWTAPSSRHCAPRARAGLNPFENALFLWEAGQQHACTTYQMLLQTPLTLPAVGKLKHALAGLAKQAQLRRCSKRGRYGSAALHFNTCGAARRVKRRRMRFMESHLGAGPATHNRASVGLPLCELRPTSSWLWPVVLAV
jgi:hypothetical protein